MLMTSVLLCIRNINSNRQEPVPVSVPAVFIIMLIYKAVWHGQRGAWIRCPSEDAGEFSFRSFDRHPSDTHLGLPAYIKLRYTYECRRDEEDTR